MRRSGVRAQVFGVKVQVLQLESRPALSRPSATSTPEGWNIPCVEQDPLVARGKPQTQQRRESALQVGI